MLFSVILINTVKICNMEKICYNTSRDYKRLKELLDEGYEVVGFTTYDFNRYHKNEPDYKPMMTTDVCYAKLFSKGTEYERYSFGVRGQGYGDYEPNYHKFSFDEFCEQCLNFEYIDPFKI